MGGNEFIGYIEGDIDEYYDVDIEEEEELTCQPYFKSESYLINARMYLRPDKDEDIERFIDRILRYANMERCPYSEKQNILIVNGNRKFTFQNTTKQDIGNYPCLSDLWKKGDKTAKRI